MTVNGAQGAETSQGRFEAAPNVMPWTWQASAFETIWNVAPSAAGFIQDPLALQILEGKVLPGDHVLVDRDGKNEAMRFERVPLKQPAAAARI